MIFTFQVEVKEPLHTGQLIKPLPNWPLVPFYYDKKLWKIEFNSDFHFSIERDCRRGVAISCLTFPPGEAVK